MKHIKTPIPALLAALTPCRADPIPVPPPPPHVALAQLALPIIVNYLWNLAVLSVAFALVGVGIRTWKFPTFVFVLTICGLVIDVAAFALADPFSAGWIVATGASLFVLSFTLTKLFYRLPNLTCAVPGLAYSIASHPLVGLTLVVLILSEFTPYSPV